jgi:hypothetical protein
MLVAATRKGTIQKRRNTVNSTTKLLTAGVAALALTGGIGATIASADTPAAAPLAAAPAIGAAPAAAPAATPKAKQNGKHRSLQARALHGEATVGGKKKQHVVDFQRGTVTKVSSTSITVKSVDGFSATYAVDAKTRVRKEKKAATITTVKPADRVRVRATDDGSTSTATVIRDHGAK